MAQGIFNSLAEEKGIEVTAESFGISTVSGLPASENSVKACAEIGVDISKLRSTSVQDAEIERYDRFYCMSESHKRILSEYFFVPCDKIRVLNVTDPYGGNLSVYRNCRDEIYNSVKEIIEDYEN